MIDNPFRAILPRFTGPLLRCYQRLGLTPNMITLAALLIATGAAAAVVLGHSYTAIALWWASRLLDGTDGIHARATGQASAFGAYLDIVCDMAAYSIMVLALALRYPELTITWLTVLLLYVLCIASALALGALTAASGADPADNRGLRLGAGLAEGGETGIAYTAFLLFPQWLTGLTQGWVAVLTVTVIARTLLARRLLRPATSRR